MRSSKRSAARVGYIQLNARPLFDVEHHDENTTLSRTANRLHIATREATIMDQLLFRSGDPYRAGLLQESARILRDTRYLRDALIRPVAYHDGVVDVEVTTQDVWTLNPGFSFGRKGGKNTGGIEVEDLNFLGMGTQLGLGLTSRHRSRFEDHLLPRPPAGLVVVGPGDALFGQQRWPPGRIRPGASLLRARQRWAAGIALLDDRRTDSRYDLGEMVDRYQTQESCASIYWGWSDGLVGRLGAALLRWA